MTKEEVIDLIKDSGFGTLATVEDNQARVRPMMPLLTDDCQNLYLALLGNSRTIDQVKSNPNVEVCFVDRKMWFARVTGQATVSDDLEIKQTLWNHIPMLRQYFGGPEDDHFVAISIDIKQVEASTPHQQSPEIVSLV